MLARLHLVRHGEVRNPDGIVYAALAGYHLSRTGRLQAEQAAAHLATLEPDLLRTSPLDRATETARRIAAATGLEAVVEDDLTEWALARRWQGRPWLEIDPAERRAYHEHPDHLPFSPEPAADMAARMAGVVARLGSRHDGAAAMLVGHRDPLQSLRHLLTGQPLGGMMEDPPGHGEVITLDPGTDAAAWAETARWRPAARSAPFPPGV